MSEPPDLRERILALIDQAPEPLDFIDLAEHLEEPLSVVAPLVQDMLARGEIEFAP